MDFDFDENNLLSKSSNNYNGMYSTSVINKKNNKNTMINNNKISKGLKESKDQLEELKKEINALKYNDKNNDINKYNGISSKTKKQKYQNVFNDNCVTNSNKIRNKSNRNNNIYNNNEIIYNVGKYKNNNINAIKNIEEEYNNYIYNKNEKNKNIILSNANSYKNIIKTNNYLSDSLNKNEYIPKDYRQNNNYDNYIYNKRNKNINFNNINIGINNNNFIIDNNNKAYQTYNGSFGPKTLKVDMDDNLNINNSNTYKSRELNMQQDIIKDTKKFSKSLNKRNDFLKGKFIIETENDRNNIKNRNKSKDVNINIKKDNNNFNNLNTNFFYNSNSHTLDGKNSKYNISLSKKNYSIPLYYSQNINTKDKNNKNEKRLNSYNTYSDGNIFNKTGSSKKNNSNRNSDKKDDKNSEFFNYNDGINNCDDEITSEKIKKNDNLKMNTMNKNTKNNILYNLNSFSQRNNNYENGNNNQLYESKNNVIKTERINNKNNNVNINQIKNNKIEYKNKLDNIKLRMKGLLNIYNYLLTNKINFDINGNFNYRNNNNNQ